MYLYESNITITHLQIPGPASPDSVYSTFFGEALYFLKLLLVSTGVLWVGNCLDLRIIEFAMTS